MVRNAEMQRGYTQGNMSESQIHARVGHARHKKLPEQDKLDVTRCKNTCAGQKHRQTETLALFTTSEQPTPGNRQVASSTPRACYALNNKAAFCC